MLLIDCKRNSWYLIVYVPTFYLKLHAEEKAKDHTVCKGKNGEKFGAFVCVCVGGVDLQLEAGM